MMNQQEVDKRAREYIRRRWGLDQPAIIQTILRNPRFRRSIVYQRIVLSVALDDLKHMFIASLPRWLRRLFQEAR